jgi:hypothetical protein
MIDPGKVFKWIFLGLCATVMFFICFQIAITGLNSRNDTFAFLGLVVIILLVAGTAAGVVMVPRAFRKDFKQNHNL